MNITERFLKYVGYGTNSDEKSETCPSTPISWCWGPPLLKN